MNWKDKLVIDILLLVARILCTDEELRKEVKYLANRIYVGSSNGTHN